MFYLEQIWENLSKQERYQLRQEKLRPLMQEFFDWCENNKTTILPGSKLGRAINYTLKHQDTFEHVLLDGNLELSNNKVERAVKSLVMGRKNSLFSQSETVDGVNVTKEEVGNTCAFLMSDLATGLTGDVIFVDKGVHLR